MSSPRERSAGEPWAGQARLSRIGFADPLRAQAQLQQLGLWDGGYNRPRDDAAAAVISALGRAADPDLACSALQAIVTDGATGSAIMAELGGSAMYRSRLLTVLGASAALGEHLALHPGDALLLVGAQDELPALDGAQQRIAAAVGADATDPVTGTGGTPAALTGPSAVTALRRAYRRELLIVAAHDLSQELALQAVTEALADLADHLLRAGLAVALATLPPVARIPCRLAVIAMGKTGGQELNYISDVDVVFVAGDDHDALPTATRLAAELMKVCGLAAWQVDAGLRPEGADGALVRTVASYTAYYQRWASTWEFQALLKARPAAGDATLGQQYLQAVTPFIWTAAERPDFVADVQAMRRRVVDQLPVDLAARELKLGAGGLRDVEFAVQLLQLVHGRADERIRVRGTLPALAALRDGGYVGREDCASFTDAYLFLRATEHRLQLFKLRRTHLIPDRPAAVRWLGRSLGFRADARGDPGQVWHAEWALHAREVRRLHEKLFYRPLLAAVSRVSSADLRLSPEQARRRLEALGYADPAGALRHLEALTSGVSRRAAIQRTLLPVLLADFADTPDPDGGLLAYRQLSDARGGTPSFLRLLRDEGAVVSRLAGLLGTSRYVAELLRHSPEALAMLADDEQLRPRRRSELAMVMMTAARRQTDPERGAGAIRAIRRTELLRIAVADLLGLISDSEVRIALTELADATLAAGLAVAQRTVANEPGRAAAADLQVAVIALGRLGGQELGYSSDADVLFVYDGLPEVGRLAHVIAERLTAILALPSADPPLVLDANLRPEGRDGPLVRSFASYAEYYERWSAVWETQALLRARFCAGSSELGERFIDLIDPVRYPVGGLSRPGQAEIRRIKGRVDAERLPRGADPHTHLKLGRGSLADVEWTVQLLQLRYADQVAGLRTPGTLPALQAAADAGLLAVSDALALEAAWRLAGRTRDAIMLVRNRAADQLPRSGRILTAVGRVLGYPPDFDAGELIDDYRRATRRARRVVDAVFYETGGQ